MTSFGTKLRGNEKLAALTDKLQNGQAAYADAYEYALEVGTALSDTFSEELSSDVLPDGKMYFNVANRVVRDPLTRAYRLIADECDGVQTGLNTAAGIGLKAQRPDYPESRIKGFVDRLSSESDYDKVSWILKEPVKTFSQSIVDDSVKKNAEMHYNAGLSPQIIRTAAAGCCEWCTEVEGTYPYPNVPKDIYRRHNFCRCQVEYDPRTGRRQDVHTRRWSDEKGYVKYRKLEENRKSYGDVTLEIKTNELLARSIDYVDYSAAHTFANGDSILIVKLRSGDYQKVNEAVEDILNGKEYDLPESKWSHITRVFKTEDMPNVLGVKELNCDITIREDQRYNLKTYIHENLHARSISRIGDPKSIREVYERNKPIEEATVEYLTQEICKQNDIPYGMSYVTWVDALRDVKKVVAPREENYEFAKKLIELPTDQRYNHLKQAVDDYKARMGQRIRKPVLDRINNDMRLLGGDRNDR